MTTNSSSTSIEMPSSWLLHYFNAEPYDRAISALPCLQEAHLCLNADDIRKTWYTHKLKAIILLVERHYSHVTPRLRTAMLTGKWYELSRVEDQERTEIS